MTSYERLEERFRRISRLENARSILQWDEAVMMPSGSSDSRNQSLAELALVIQNLVTGPEVGDWIADSEALTSLTSIQSANLREMKRIFIENTAIPPELNQKLVLARMTSEQRWRVLRARNDWAGFMPYLRETLSLTREMLQGLAARRGLPVYDTALSLYSNGLTTEVVESLFSEIKSFLPALIRDVVDKQRFDRVLVPEGHFPMAAQKAMGRELMNALGFSFDIGRLDESHHPFCGGTPRDVRITTRYNESEFVSALMGVLHETGHAMYEQNLPEGWLGQPAGASAGMSIHESQSLLWEMQVCRSREFMSFAAPIIQKHLAAHARNPEALSAENLAALVTRVNPGYIRVEADEVTYPAHVILRFEIERGLLEGNVQLEDLPALWSEKMGAYLRLSTEGNDKDGCMQDVHWPAGLFGYFPAYTFGAVIAAQLFERVDKTAQGARDAIANGDFKPVRYWLENSVWSKGAELTTLDLVRDAAGPLSASAFRAHLNRRYLA